MKKIVYIITYIDNLSEYKQTCFFTHSAVETKDAEEGASEELVFNLSTLLP